MARIALILALLLGSARPVMAGEVGDETPSSIVKSPGVLAEYESHVFRTDPELKLYVVKPKGWKATDKRPSLVFFFGGGFVKGSPEKSVGWAKWAAKNGMVGIAPDYRVKERFAGVHPADGFGDGRRAVRWIQEHAAELGIDPGKVAVGGNSAGGGIALWTAITPVPGRSTPEDTPLQKPAALVLMSAPSDATGSKGKRFGDVAESISALQHLDKKMPPIIMFHGDADMTVPYSQAVKLNEKLLATKNDVEFVTVPGGGHGFSTTLPVWKEKSRAMILAFLDKHGLIPHEEAKQEKAGT